MTSHRLRALQLWIGRFILTVAALAWVVPLVWVVITSFRPTKDVVGRLPFQLSRLTLANYQEAWAAAPFAQYFVNTIEIVLGILVVQLITITLAGYAFARLRFPGRDALFFLFLLQLMIPNNALIFPNYLTIHALGLLDTKTAIMAPYFASAFGTFLMRQTFRTIPKELEEAAVVDGCTWVGLLRHVYVPSARPAMVAFALVSASFHWNDFFWPLIVTNSEHSRPLTVGLALLTQMGQTGSQWTLISAGTLLVVAPLLVVFLLFQRQFVNSFLQSGLK